MSTSMGTEVFKAGGALYPSDTAYAAGIYRRRGLNGGHRYFGYEPPVIASPALTGKTTQVNHIFQQQRRANYGSEAILNECVIPKKPGGVDEDGLRSLLRETLGVNGEPITLSDIVRKSQQRECAQVGMLAVIATENLQTDALRWLLRSTVDWEEHDIRDFKVVIDGSFSLETMTSGPNSEFPMAQTIVPPEFDSNEQVCFVNERLAKFGAQLAPEAASALWRVTAGEKYAKPVSEPLCCGLHLRVRYWLGPR